MSPELKEAIEKLLVFDAGGPFPEDYSECLSLLADDYPRVTKELEAVKLRLLSAAGDDLCRLSQLIAENQRLTEVLEAIDHAIPPTLYADMTISFRVEMLVAGWRRAVEAEAKLAAIEAACRPDAALKDLQG